MCHTNNHRNKGLVSKERTDVHDHCLCSCGHTKNGFTHVHLITSAISLQLLFDLNIGFTDF